MTIAWYYADKHHQQQGPVAADWFADAMRRGDVGTATLVWRAGLPGWVPLAQVAGELGIATPVAPPPRPATAAPTYTPRYADMPSMPGEKRVTPTKSGGTRWWVIVLIVVIALVPIVGIIAAITIPAYHDYTQRARIANSLLAASTIKADVATFRITEERCPSNGEGGILKPEDYATDIVTGIDVGKDDDDRCTITINYQNVPVSAGTHPEIRMTLVDDTTWQTTSTLPQKMLPASLRY